VLEFTLNVIFRKSSEDYFVISPMGHLSLFSFVTKEEAEHKRAKQIYYLLFIFAVPVCIGHYLLFNNISHPLKWPSLVAIFLGINTILYVALALSFVKIEIYKAKTHGVIVES